MAILGYSLKQHGWLAMISIIHFLCISFNAIAAQNERSGFVTMISYIGIVYAFLGDLFIFH